MQSSHEPECMVCSLRVSKGSKSNLIIFKLMRCIEIERRRSERIISLPSESSFRQLVEYMLKEDKGVNNSSIATQEPHLSPKSPLSSKSHLFPLSPEIQEPRTSLSITSTCSHNIIKQVITKKLQITLEELYNFCEKIFEKLSRRRFELELVEKIVKNIHERVVGVELKDCWDSKGDNKLALKVKNNHKNVSHHHNNNKLRKLTTCESIKPILESPPSNVNNNNILTPSPSPPTATSTINTTNNHPITYEPEEYGYNSNKQEMAKQELLLPLPLTFGENNHFLLPFNSGYGLIDHGIITNTAMNNNMSNGLNNIGQFCFFSPNNNLWMG